eukprot:gene6079-8374_t
MTSFSYPISAISSISDLNHKISQNDDNANNNIYQSNKKLLDIVFGTITTMYYDQTGGQKFTDDQIWRNHMKKIQENGDLIYNSNKLTEIEIKKMIEMLDDRYSYYTPPIVRHDMSYFMTKLNQLRITTQQHLNNNNNDNVYKSVYNKNGRILDIPKLGIQLQEQINDIYQVYDANDNNNKIKLYTRIVPIITAVYPHSPAEKIGLRSGDIIMKINDIDVTYTSQQYVNENNENNNNNNNMREVNPSLSLSLNKLKTPILKKILHITNHDINIASNQGHDTTLLSSLFSHDNNGNNNNNDDQTHSSYYHLDILKKSHNNLYKTINNNNLQKTKSDDSTFSTSIAPNYNYLNDFSKNPVTYKQLKANNNVNVDYIRITSFRRETSQQLKEILFKIASNQNNEDNNNNGIVSNIRPSSHLIVIDLRNNYGGVIQDAMISSSVFLSNPKDIICYTVTSRGIGEHDVEELLSIPELNNDNNKYTNDVRENFRKQLLVPDTVPVVILVNGGTASAAEVFSAALHDNNRAIIIGKRTYGKSLIQHEFELPNGGTLHLTTAQYLTPTKKHLSREYNYNADNRIIPIQYLSHKPSLIHSLKLSKINNNIPNDMDINTLSYMKRLFFDIKYHHYLNYHSSDATIHQILSNYQQELQLKSTTSMISNGPNYYDNNKINYNNNNNNNNNNKINYNINYFLTKDQSEGGGIFPDLECVSEPQDDIKTDLCVIEATSIYNLNIPIINPH